MNTTATVWKLFLLKAFVSTLPTSTQLGRWDIPVIILTKYKHVSFCLPVILVAYCEVCTSGAFALVVFIISKVGRYFFVTFYLNWPDLKTLIYDTLI